MNVAIIGVLLTLLFVFLEATQFVYFGGLFQQMSSFHYGALVFGSMILLFVGGTAIRDPQVLRHAWNNPRPVIAVNLCVVFALGAYLLSVQLVEPAITYAISSAAMPVTTYVLFRLGVQEGEGMRNRTEGAGTFLLFISILYLGYITISGQSGFVRGGGTAAAVGGVGLAIIDGVLFTWVLVISQRLNKVGIGPGAVLGLRLPLYVLVASALTIAGVDAREPLPLSDIAFFVLVGLLLTVPPLYALQKAISMVSTLTISSLTALGPFVIFALQMVEGRVAYSDTTLVGLAIYSLASMLSAIGAVRAATQSG
ncbi:MAG: hypothetical protein AAF530_09820 [Pseudomonadota bacterium]